MAARETDACPDVDQLLPSPVGNGARECSVPGEGGIASESNVQQGFLVVGYCEREGGRHDQTTTGDVDDDVASANPQSLSRGEQPQDPSVVYFKSLFEPITSLLKFSFQRVPEASPNMGNLQGNDSKNKNTGKSPAKGKKEKLGKKSPVKELFKSKALGSTSKINQHPNKAGLPREAKGGSGLVRPGDAPLNMPVPTNGNNQASETDAGRRAPASSVDASETTYVVTDSWRHVKKLAIQTPTTTSPLTPQSRESSSDSIFTDPLTPQGFAEANNHSITSSYYSDTGGATLPSIDSNKNTELKMVRTSAVVESNRNDIMETNIDLHSATDADDITLTLADSSEHVTDSEQSLSSSSRQSIQTRRPQSSSLDALDEEVKAKSSDGLEMTSPGPQRTSQPPSSFTLVRHRKVELAPITGVPGVCTSGQPPADPSRDLRRHSSVTDVPLDSNVLRKVASLTLDKATLEQRIAKPRFVPEKLDFQIYEKFEGQMLINWFVSAFPEEHYLRLLLTAQDLKILAAQFCTHLLAAGVVRQIPDKEVALEALFRPDLMYYWAHSELPAAAPPTPGRLSTAAWPPSLPSGLPPDVVQTASTRPGARYTEAEMSEDCLGPSSAPVTPGNVDKSVRKLEGEEFQQVVMGLKREHRDNLQRLSRSQELALFTVRGEQAQKLCEAEERIILMEQTIQTLRRELESFQTIAGIQSLTHKANTDFDSPETEQKKLLSLETEQLGEQVKEPEQTETVLLVEIPPTSHQSTDTSDLPSVLPESNASDSKPPELSVRDESTQTTPDVILKEDSLATLSSETNVCTPILGALKDNEPDSTAGKSETSPSSELKPAPPEVAVAAMAPPPPPPPPPPPMSPMGPPPPPMPCIGPPPPPMPGMGPCPPPPPMPGMGPPPPPMPGMVPPPPPMMGMGQLPIHLGAVPPPPPAPGMGPPPPPPAPGMSPMPFPSPPVGGWMANKAMPPGLTIVLRKEPLNPVVPMKPLYWTRIIVPQSTESPALAVVLDPPPPQPEASPPAVAPPCTPLWVKLEEENIEDMDEFHKRFSRQVIERVPTKKKQSKPSKHQAVKILDGKRSQNVGILAQSLHVDFSEIENAIYSFDTSVVNLEALQQIYDVRATDEELQLIQTHLATKPDVPLDKPEQFLNELAGIPNFADRIACFMFQTEFNDGMSSVESKLNNIKSTCHFLMSSESLKTVLAIILTLGNYMNGGNRTRGQADGFGLEILAKLRDVKSNDNSITLLHFIVKAYMKKCEDPLSSELALPVPEPGDIERAAHVNFDDLGADLTKMQRELKVCELKKTKVIAASTEENLQPFKEKMETFIGSAKKQLAGEFENLEECKQKFKTTVDFFQYKLKGSEEDATKDFFSHWIPFCFEFKDIWKKEQQRIIKEKTQEAKRIQSEKKNVKTSKKDEGGLKAKLQRMSMGKR